jgi:hypothetical protein
MIHKKIQEFKKTWEIIKKFGYTEINPKEHEIEGISLYGDFFVLVCRPLQKEDKYIKNIKIYWSEVMEK